MCLTYRIYLRKRPRNNVYTVWALIPLSCCRQSNVNKATTKDGTPIAIPHARAILSDSLRPELEADPVFGLVEVSLVVVASVGARIPDVKDIE